MGLRLVAHYFERSEALIVWSALDAAGVPAFVHGLDVCVMRPWDEVAFGGYRIVVSEDDLAAPVGILGEARKKPIFEGERLVTRHYIAVSVIPILAFLVWGWIPYLPFRSHDWRSVEPEGASDP